MKPAPPYLAGLRVIGERVPPDGDYPFCLPFVRHLDLTISSAVTIFVGENGSGKSTLLEAIAVLARLPLSGGARADLGAGHAPEERSALADVLRPSFRRRPRDGYFLRAEFQAHFASLLDARAADPEFTKNPYTLYGGKSLHSRSHGEAFLAVIQSRFEEGLFLLDEPEAALSPQRQLVLLAQMQALVEAGSAQFLMATHSPILMTYPDAELVSFDDPALPHVSLEETSHFQITRGILENPARYWRHLRSREPG
ncbi:MAG TPA: AAA family ATPase [Verrucomicrobiae bacterium]|nr:AAA family ATPase [Verrucomicrobiae bacterium]